MGLQKTGATAIETAITLDQVTDVTSTIRHAALSHDTRPRQVQSPDTRCRAGQPTADDRKCCTLCALTQLDILICSLLCSKNKKEKKRLRLSASI